MNKVFGKSGEDRAADFLRAKGYKILVRNHRTRFGEIDIIAQDGGALVFVEVKARNSNVFGRAVDAVDRRKLAKLKLVIQDFVASHQITAPIRCEVVAIEGINTPELVSEIDFTDLD